MRHTETALRWIVGILTELNVPYEIDGGLAAEMYGSPRELADLDFGVHSEHFEKIVPRIKEYLTFGPAWYEDHEWKVYEMSFKYAGQNIDIAALDKMSYFDRTTSTWMDFSTDLSNVTYKRYLDMDLPFINEATLIDYKKRVGRGVDRKDVAAMRARLDDTTKSAGTGAAVPRE